MSLRSGVGGEDRLARSARTPAAPAPQPLNMKIGAAQSAADSVALRLARA